MKDTTIENMLVQYEKSKRNIKLDNKSETLSWRTLIRETLFLIGQKLINIFFSFFFSFLFFFALRSVGKIEKVQKSASIRTFFSIKSFLFSMQDNIKK